MPKLKNILQADYRLEDKYVPDFDELACLVKQFKDGGFKISLTQGVFDMFHVGHGRYLAEARENGDVLIVGVDSDELTRQMKGPNRPFDDFDQRIEVLAMLAFVNIITKRDVGQDKYDLIKLVQPDVLIMSQTTRSFSEADIAELTPHCGVIKHLEAKAATTTTAKMRRLMEDGARELASQINDDLAQFTNRVGERVRTYLQGDGKP